MDAATEDELRLARRLKLGVRLVVYPALLVLIAVAWHARQVRGAEDEASWTPPQPTAVWKGTTAQGRPASVRLYGDEIDSSFDLRTTCSGGGWSQFVWTPRAGQYHRHQPDGRFIARVTPHMVPGRLGPVLFSGRADVALAKGSAEATVTIHWEWFDHGVRAGSCDATDVAVRLRGG